VQGPAGGVAVRQSSHSGAAALVAALDGPLISTSANLAGQPTPTDADGIEAEFAPVLDQLLVLDGGRLPPSPPSTVVDLCGRAPVLVREGAIAWNDGKKARPDECPLVCTGNTAAARWQSRSCATSWNGGIPRS
jgi:L-threonylcarbamoyladenylate synthase